MRQLWIAIPAVFVFCAPKAPPIAYLAPLDRVQEGFLDSTTYQIVAFGAALDFSKPIDASSHFFPHSINEAFDHEEFMRYNGEQQNLIKARKPATGFTFVEVMNAEANQLNPQDLNLAAVDEKIRGPMEVKRVLFDNACNAAIISGLYRWLISDAMQMKLLHGATLPREGLPKTGLDTKFFPPRVHYVAESKVIIEELTRAMKKKKFAFEIVHEIFSKPEQLECKVAIHIHKKNLQVNTQQFLAPL